jgi:hypothetical protein
LSLHSENPPIRRSGFYSKRRVPQINLSRTSQLCTELVSIDNVT